jgi:hypothetical protein
VAGLRLLGPGTTESPSPSGASTSRSPLGRTPKRRWPTTAPPAAESADVSAASPCRSPAARGHAPDPGAASSAAPGSTSATATITVGPSQADLCPSTRAAAAATVRPQLGSCVYLSAACPTSRIVQVGCRLTRIPALARPTARARHLALAGTEQLRRGSDRSEDRAPRCRRVDGEESRVEPDATAAGTGCRPMALTARSAGRSLGAARASGDADGAPQC